MREAPDPNVLVRRLGDEVVLVHLETGQLYELNHTGGRLWELLAAGLERADIEQRLLAEFDVELAVLQAEIDRLLAELRSARLLTPAPPASPP